MVGHDASGNPILKDIGTYLRDNIKKHISVRVYGFQCSCVVPVATRASGEAAGCDFTCLAFLLGITDGQLLAVHVLRCQCGHAGCTVCLASSH